MAIWNCILGNSFDISSVYLYGIEWMTYKYGGNISNIKWE